MAERCQHSSRVVPAEGGDQPITPGADYYGRHLPPSRNETTRRMGPHLRGDDAENVAASYIKFPIQISNSHPFVIPGRAPSARTRNPEMLNRRPQCLDFGFACARRKRPGRTWFYSLAARCVRGLPVPREPARGDGAAGGARAPAGTLGGGINVPTSRGKATARAQGRRCASRRSTWPPGRRPFRGACRIASRKRPLIGQD
jgi:hypothetical protein